MFDFTNQIENDKLSDADGLTVIEIVIAMVILMIALLGISAVFSFAVTTNAGNNSRAQALTVMQQEVENIRSAKFTPLVMEAALAGGSHATRRVTTPDGGVYIVNTTVDDKPMVAGVQINNSSTLKEITVEVRLDRPTPGWQLAVPATVVLRRVRGN
ncbi:MAG: hypothetical protein ACK5NT_13760 [Pyrinomonadaceae bacterium]